MLPVDCRGAVSHPLIRLRGIMQAALARLKGETGVARNWPDTLRRIRIWGLALLVLQLLFLLVWSDVLYRHFALTGDFSVYSQAWYLIAHGHLDPYSSWLGLPFIRNDLELALWLLAPLWYIWPHSVTLLWAQDMAIVLSEGVVMTWMCELLLHSETSPRHSAHGRRPHARSLLALAGVALTVACPWIVWAVSFDFHTEAIVLLPVLLVGRSLWRGHSRSLVSWLLVSVAIGGSVGATYLLGLGLGWLAVGSSRRRLGLVVAALGLVELTAIGLFHLDHGGLSVYAYLTRNGSASSANMSQLAAGLARHPSIVASGLWKQRLDVFADVSVGGAVGVLAPFSIGIVAITLVINALATGTSMFITPAEFQNLPVFLLVPVGSVFVWARMASSRIGSLRLLAVALAALSVVNVAGWDAVWVPRAFGEFQRVPSTTAAELTRVQRLMQGSDEVIASQGVLGRLSDRSAAYALQPGTIPVISRTVWIVAVANAGIETATPADTLSAAAEAQDRLHAKLIIARAGVYAFRWETKSRSVTFHAARVLPAWTLQGAYRSTSGPSAFEIGGSRPGYVAYGDYWWVTPGNYRATATLSSTGPVFVELWNDSRSQLLDRVAVRAGPAQAVPLSAVVRQTRPATASGPWPFRIDLGPGSPTATLEIRIWSPGDETVRFYSVALGPAHRP
jgi:hypothetical protein